MDTRDSPSKLFLLLKVLRALYCELHRCETFAHMRENGLTYARPRRNYPKKYIAIWQIARRGRHNPFYAPAIKSGNKNAISLPSIKQG